MHTILVTGATGTVGSATIKALTAQGLHVRAGVHSIIKGERLKHPQVELAEMDYGRPESLQAAMTGIEKMVLITPFSENQLEMVHKAVEQAKKCGVKHVVRLSAIGADAEPGIKLGRWHREAEKAVEQSGIPFTHLRPNSFMQNFINFHGHSIQTESRFYAPAGHGKISYIDVHDIAQAIAGVLTGNEHLNQAYNLTGPQAVSADEIATELSLALGRVVTFVDIPAEEARKSMLGQHMPVWLADALLELYALGKAGHCDLVEPNVEKITGNKPRTFPEFIAANKQAFETQEELQAEKK